MSARSIHDEKLGRRSRTVAGPFAFGTQAECLPALHSSVALEGVSELMTGVVRRVRFEETSSSSAFSNPG